MGKNCHLKPEVIANVINLHKQGIGLSEVAIATGLSERGARNWVNRFYEGGGVMMPTYKPRPGKSKITTPNTMRIIHNEIVANPAITSQQIKDNNPDAFKDISVRTITRRIKELGHRRVRPVKERELSFQQRMQRLAFAGKYGQWREEQWKWVLWSDETTFPVNRNFSRKRNRGHVTKHPESLVVWGCFGYYGLGALVMLPKSQYVNQHMNQDNYFELLCEYLPDAFERCHARVFMHDSAPRHRARSVVRWLLDCQVPFFHDWPGNSPDLNPIEDIWKIIKKGLQDKDVCTLPHLEAEIRTLWNNIPLETLRNLSTSLSMRLREVCWLNGENIQYPYKSDCKYTPFSFLRRKGKYYEYVVCVRVISFKN